MRTRNKWMTLLLAAICGVSIMTVPVKAETENADSEFVTASEYAANNGAEENVRNFVKRLYRVILNREAEENGLNAWTKQLMDRKASGAQIVCGFVESDEFTQRGLTNEEVVEIMYLAMLDRASDDVGREGWTKILDGGCSYVYIVNGFAGSAEFNGICNTYGIDAGIVDTDRKRDRNPQLTQFVSRCYTQALGRQYEVNGLENWCDAIIGGRNTPKQAAQMFIFSDEFLQKDLSSEEYVKVLYRTFMGREADEVGLNGWIEVLESGREDRMKVLEGFSDSVEFAGILESFGLSTGGGGNNNQTPTMGEKNALSKAKDYLSVMAFSYKGLIRQLEYEKFTHEEAVYAADNCGADWNEQAAQKAKDYLSFTAFSYKGLIRQLEHDKFTHEEAVYAADNCGADWNEQAAQKAKAYLESMSFSKNRLIEQLEYEGFTHEQAVYGVEQNGY